MAETQTQAPEKAKRGPRGARRGGERRGRDRGERRERSEYEQKILAIRRVARVVSGGRRFSFSVTVAAGDMKGKVGVGLGKGADTAAAIEKAMRDAKKNMITVPLTKSSSIAHDVSAKYGASSVVVRPAPSRGVVAGGAVRTVLELAGVKDVSGKILSRSKNHLNNARATIQALKKLS